MLKKAFGKTAALAVAVVASTGSAVAAVPTEASAAITEVGTDGSQIIAEVWPVAVIVIGGGIVLKLFKKFVSKAT